MSRSAESKRRLALLGVFANRVTPQGAPPSEEELIALAELRISEPRRSELLSSLAASPELYARFTTIAETLSPPEDAQSVRPIVIAKPSPRWKRWVPLAAAASVIAFTLGITFKLTGSGNDYFDSGGFLSAAAQADWNSWPSRIRGVQRSTGLSVSDRDRLRTGFSEGVASSLREWSTAPGLSSRLSAASDAEACPAQTTAAACVTGRRLGTWTARSYAQCSMKNSPPAEAWSAHLAELGELGRTLAAIPDAADIAEDVVSLHASLLASGHFDAAGCGGLRSLIARASEP